MNLTHRELAHVLLGLRTLQYKFPEVLHEDNLILDGAKPMSLDELDDLCEKLNVADEPVIYDSWDEVGTVDRYTVFPFPDHPDAAMRRTYLGCSEGGLAVSMWGELSGVTGDVRSLDHLGRRVTLEGLDEETRQHILSRIKEAS